jgi:predicted transcriptional regulator
VSAGKGRVNQTIDVLASTGMPKGTARTLAFLSTKDEWSTSKDIEKATRLRQPEVSIAVRGLLDRGWLERDSLKRESKGRPINIYRMNVDLLEVFRSIEAEEMEKVAEVHANLDQIRELWDIKK